MFERFTDRGRKVMALADQEAQRFNHEYIGTEHILLGLVKEGSGVGAQVLKDVGVDLRRVRAEVEKLVKPASSPVTTGKLPQTPRTKRVIEYAIQHAQALNHNHVGTEHLLLGLLSEMDGVAAQILMNLGAYFEDVRQRVINVLGADGSRLSAPPSAARPPDAIFGEFDAVAAARRAPPPGFARDVKLIRTENSRQLVVLGVVHRVRLTGADTGGQLTLIEVLAPPNSGLPLHTHTREDEIFHIVTGSARFTIGGVVHDAPAGTTVLAPRNVPHTFRIAPDGATILVTTVPAGIEDMFAELDRLPPGLPDMARVVEICERYGVLFHE